MLTGTIRSTSDIKDFRKMHPRFQGEALAKVRKAAKLQLGLLCCCQRALATESLPGPAELQAGRKAEGHCRQEGVHSGAAGAELGAPSGGGCVPDPVSYTAVHLCGNSFQCREVLPHP